MVGLEHYLTVAAALFAVVHHQFWALRRQVVTQGRRGA
jgi:hypothetical protein